MRLGGEMQVKVLEALDAGKVVVASSLATEGPNLVDGEGIVIAESDEQFREAILQLLRNPARRASIASKAHAWASKLLSCIITYRMVL